MKADADHKVVAAHQLQPMLSPKSVALVGASPRPGSVGNAAARALLDGGFEGELNFINPRHASVEDRPCLGDLSDLETPPDLAVLNVGARRMEATLNDAIEAGVRSAVIFDGCFGEAADGSPLIARLRDMAREARLPVCGGNGMGFINVQDRCHASFYSAGHLKPGGISLIAHSGSVFTVLALNDPRYRFDVMVSSGQEIGTSIDEYVDFASLRPTTKVIALFMEAARNPQGFCRALDAACRRGTPVVVCKVGRSDKSAQLARSHSGAMAGDSAAYDAVLDRYGAIGVSTVDELMNTAMLLAQGRDMAEGEAAFVTDSGGLRELFIDRSASRGVPLAELSEETGQRLRQFLPADLPVSNPLDCAGALDDNFANVFERSLRTLGEAPEVGLLGFEIDARDDHVYDPRLLDIASRLDTLSPKPCFVYSSFAQTHNRQIADRLADAGIPQLNGLDETLSAVNSMRAFREHRQRCDAADPLPDLPVRSVVEFWQQRLVSGKEMGEAGALDLLSAFGIPAVGLQTGDDAASVLGAAQALGYPVVLKSAQPGLAHKSDVGGVLTGIGTAFELEAAYKKMSGRLGPQVLVQQMAKPGVELAFGCVRDADFGPLVMVAAGGTLIELLDDRQFAMAPFGPAEARHLLSKLKVSPVLAGMRGVPACDIAALALALSRFSVLCAELQENLVSMDVNPVIVRPDGLTAVDAFIEFPTD